MVTDDSEMSGESDWEESELSEYSEVLEVWDVSDESKSKLLSKHSSTPG